MKTLRCRDVGFDCTAVVHGETDEEILSQAAAHVKAVHNLNEISDETVAQIRSVIRDDRLSRPE